MTHQRPPAHTVRRILVAIDSSPQAHRALEDAVGLAHAHNARLTVMMVVPKPAVVVLGYGVPVYTEDPWERIERECAAALDGSMDGLPAWLPVTKVLKHGHPARAILQEARTNDYDLLVMGSRGRSELRSLFFGSVCHDVIQASPVPVLVSTTAR